MNDRYDEVTVTLLRAGEVVAFPVKGGAFTPLAIPGDALLVGRGSDRVLVPVSTVREILELADSVGSAEDDKAYTCTREVRVLLREWAKSGQKDT